MYFGYVNAITGHICPEDGTVGLIYHQDADSKLSNQHSNLSLTFEPGLQKTCRVRAVGHNQNLLLNSEWKRGPGESHL
ncbi:hypothetical protein XENOCAPTIV_014692 [Xenoophorus captivus]|uniref:MHC class I antigen n=1 Tax=Xenoophorus captivus TaxID=1517983 RepID=A0ABV0Q9Y1_9TELE